MRGKRPTKTAISFYILLAIVLILLVVGYLSKLHLSVLSPSGTVAQKERNLMFLALGLCAIVVVPVFSLATLISLRYREGNKRPKKYSPDWDGSRALETTWWGVPFAIITILAVVTWQSSYSLDPYKPLVASQPPLNVQVVALDWRWLFIYPEQKISTINWLEIPVNRPISFHITSDSVMNSFWVPALGSQIYAMPGMDTQLNLMAFKTGDFHGSSANISGRGFSNMSFTTIAASQTNFDAWAKTIKNGGFNSLNKSTYQTLSRPSLDRSVRLFSVTDQNLYRSIINSYAAPGAEGGHHG